MIHKLHRTMARSPVHLTREPTMAFYARMQLEPPWHFLDRQQKHLIESFQSRRATLMSDVTRTDPMDVCVYRTASCLLLPDLL